MPRAWKIHEQRWTPPGRRTFYFGDPDNPQKRTINDSDIVCDKWFDWSIRPMLVLWEDKTWSVMPETAVLILVLNDSYRLKRAA